jgi:hypothetical protein
VSRSASSKDVALSLLRWRLIRVQAIAELVERVDELATGVVEQRRQTPALTEVIDTLERDVMKAIEARVGQGDAGG